jgi:hypothetical protein
MAYNSKLSRAAALLFLLGGCVALHQTDTQVFTREPGHRFLAGPQSIFQEAKKDWQFALISEAAYRRSLSRESAVAHDAALAREVANSPPDLKASKIACADVDASLVDAGWKRWMDFPDAQLEADMGHSHLRAEVWENDKLSAVVVAFGGTVFTSGKDWKSNLRWFIPLHDDEYTELVKKFAPAFVAESARRMALPDGAHLKGATLYSTGHSLGGGLAQQFAYAMPATPEVNPVSQVYAFDPSPVTGFYSVPTRTRDKNKNGLKIDRIYERGEVLAILRSFTSLFYPPSTLDPAVRGVRYSLFYSFDPVASHSMIGLACQLKDIAKQEPAG